MIPITDLIRSVEYSFILEELDELTFVVGLEGYNVATGFYGESTHAKIRNLVLHIYRNGLLDPFLELCREHRPNREWPIASDIEVYRNQDDSLQSKIAAYFSIEEIEDLCLSLRFDFNDLKGTTKRDKVTFLVAYVHQRGWLEGLIQLCTEQKPWIAWPSVNDVKVDDEQNVSNIQLTKILQTFYPNVWQEIIDRQLYKPTHTDLLRKIRDHFNLSEIKDICFSLNVRYEDLAGDTHLDKTRELIEFARRTQVMSSLIAVCQDIRPTISWDYFGSE